MVPLLYYIIVSPAMYCEQGTIHVNQIRSKSVVIYTENPSLSPQLQRESTNKGLSRQTRTAPLIPLSRLERDFQEDVYCKKSPSSISPTRGWKEALQSGERSAARERAFMPSSLSEVGDWVERSFPQILCTLTWQIFVEYHYLPRIGIGSGEIQVNKTSCLPSWISCCSRNDTQAKT